MDNVFINDSQNTDKSIVNSVYANFDSTNYIQPIDLNECVQHIKFDEHNTSCLSFEFINSVFSNNNSNRYKQSICILPLIADDYSLIEYVINNKLLLDTELHFMLCTLLSTFSVDNTCITSLNLIYNNTPSASTIDITLFVIMCLTNNINDGIALLEWIYEKSTVNFATIIGHLIINDKFSQVAFDLLNKYNDCLKLNNYVIIRSMCLTFDLNTILKYSSNMDDLPLKEMLEISIKNTKHVDVFNYLYDKTTYKCCDIKLILHVIQQSNFEVALKLLTTFTETIDEKTEQQIINILCNLEDIPKIEFILNNFKINFHFKDDILLRTYIANENVELVKLLFENSNFQLNFNKQQIELKIKKLIRIISNSNLGKYILEQLV